MTVALLSGPLYHHLDHLAPLAYFLQIPLFVDDASVYEMGKLHYPDVDISLKAINLQELGTNFQRILLSTQGAASTMRMMFHSLGFTTMQFCYCPHGHSDKGEKDPEMIRIIDQDLILLYGPLQYERLKKIGPLPPHLFVGNYRAHYYETHKESLSLFPKQQKTLLYAPTWDDTEHGTSFLTHYEELIEKLPDDLNLLIKLHPFLEKYHPAHAYRAAGLANTKPNLRVLIDFPKIYPLMATADFYLGDYSAIGYDFLHFNRPMFFFAKDKVPLHSCGISLKTIDELYQKIDDPQEDLREVRKQLYKETFSTNCTQDHLQEFHRLHCYHVSSCRNRY